MCLPCNRGTRSARGARPLARASVKGPGHQDQRRSAPQHVYPAGERVPSRRPAGGANSMIPLGRPSRTRARPRKERPRPGRMDAGETPGWCIAVRTRKARGRISKRSEAERRARSTRRRRRPRAGRGSRRRSWVRSIAAMTAWGVDGRSGARRSRGHRRRAAGAFRDRRAGRAGTGCSTPRACARRRPDCRRLPQSAGRVGFEPRPTRSGSALDTVSSFASR